MKTTTMTALRSHPGEVAAAVANTPQGLVLTRRGKPVAILAPLAQAEREAARDAAAREELLTLQRMASEGQTEPFSVADLMEEERR